MINVYIYPRSPEAIVQTIPIPVKIQPQICIILLFVANSQAHCSGVIHPDQTDITQNGIDDRLRIGGISAHVELYIPDSTVGGIFTVIITAVYIATTSAVDISPEREHAALQIRLSFRPEGIVPGQIQPLLTEIGAGPGLNLSGRIVSTADIHPVVGHFFLATVRIFYGNGLRRSGGMRMLIFKAKHAILKAIYPSMANGIKIGIDVMWDIIRAAHGMEALQCRRIFVAILDLNAFFREQIYKVRIVIDRIVPEWGAHEGNISDYLQFAR
ncbi:hypothetical protein DSECCO2_469630 [anaerobic digester metagenome]